jgi:hypothetical protein
MWLLVQLRWSVIVALLAYGDLVDLVDLVVSLWSRFDCVTVAVSAIKVMVCD